MTRHERRRRQVDELLALCSSGRLTRAVDLAFEHASRFGGDDAVLDALQTALDDEAAPAELRRRVQELARLTGANGAPARQARPG